MNCDTAFDLMTDANGSRSGALAQHFETCPRCRQMQETLAPALDFLTQDEMSHGFSAGPDDFASLEAGSRQPLVTVESLKFAYQAASRLAAQAKLPRVRRQHLAILITRYAAVFAAGILLALALFPARETEKANPAGECRRREALAKSSGRSAEAIQSLAQSCAVCHAATPAPAQDKNTSLLLFRSERANSWDWLAPFFREDHGPINDSRFVAGSNLPADSNAICQRVPPSIAAKEITA